MVTKRRVSLNGVQLDSIDSRIIIQGVYPQAGKENINTVSVWGGTGSRVTGIHRDYLDVNVKFAINIKKDRFAERAEVFEKVMAWAAGGGWLMYNGKPSRKLRVIGATFPAEGDATEWTSEYQMTLRAYGVPYWQTESATKVTVPGIDTGSTNFQVTGNTTTAMDLQFTNTSGATIDSFSAKAGKSKIAFSNLGLANREILKIDHNDNGKRCVLRIRIENTAGVNRSVLEKRTIASDDDLYVDPGIVSVQLESEGRGTLELSCNGRFL